MDNIVVYRYLRNDTAYPVYIGIGTLKRARDTKNGRSEFFKRIRDKHGIELEIVEERLDWNTAAEKEKWWIALYGRIDNGTGILCNLTDGGEGRFGCKLSPESIQKGKDTKARNGLAGMLGKTHTEEVRKRISKAHTGRKRSAETCKNIGDAIRGKKKTMTPKFLKSIAARKGKKTAFTREVINTITGETFSCINMAAESAGIRTETLGRKLRGDRTNNTCFLFLTDYKQVQNLNI